MHTIYSINTEKLPKLDFRFAASEVLPINSILSQGISCPGPYPFFIASQIHVFDKKVVYKKVVLDYSDSN